MQRIGQQETSRESRQSNFEQEGIDKVQYFFARLKTIYGATKFNACYPTDADLKFSKREWYPEISKLSRDDIDRGLNYAKSMMSRDDTYAWANCIAQIVAAAKPVHNPAHHLLTFRVEETPEEKAERIERNKIEIAKLKALLEGR